MLTAEQLEARTRCIGSSDAHVLAGVDGPGKRTLLDLWATKRRGADLELDPLVPPGPAEDSVDHHAKLWAGNASPMLVGNAFESSAVALYEAHTGESTMPHGAMVHPFHDWMGANPDRVAVKRATRKSHRLLVMADEAEAMGYMKSAKQLRLDAGPMLVRDTLNATHGLECKMVGRWGASRWGKDGLPAYVLCQVQWAMACSGLARWDVCAWISGTEVRIVSVERDDDLIAGLLELAEVFWTRHVIANEPPKPESGDDLRRFVNRRWPKDTGELVELTGSRNTQAESLARRVAELDRQMAILKKDKAEETGKLIAMVGAERGIGGPWGKFTNATRAGRVSWKEVAIELASGAVDAEVLERHRGAPYRHPSLRMFKPKTKRAKPAPTIDDTLADIGGHDWENLR